MHEYVQKLTSTTLPRRALLVNGGEFSQATAPSKSGILPSSFVADAIAATPMIRAAAEIQNARFFIVPSQSSLLATANDVAARFYCGSSVPACSATIYAAYHSGQFSSRFPRRF